MRFKEFVSEDATDLFKLMGQLNGPSFKPADFVKQATGLDQTDISSNPITSLTNPSTGNNMLPVKGQITSPFGKRQRGMHYGTDFGVPIGTPVAAPEDGVVFQAGPAGDAGIMVSINAGNVQHKLMHLSAIKVKPGEKVKKGQVVGLSGNTGMSTGPHLHWGKYVAGSPVDAMRNIG